MLYLFIAMHVFVAMAQDLKKYGQHLSTFGVSILLWYVTLLVEYYMD